jgi:CBS domain containing-hemolysin-like protein
VSGTEQPNAPVVANTVTGEVTADVSAPLGKPSRRTVSLVWLGVVYANIAVMLIAAVSLAIALFFPDTASLAKPETLLILFTTPAAFLAGLIARDPGQHN